MATAIVTTIIFASCASYGLPRYDERPYNKPMTLVKAAGEDYVISDYESFALYSDPLVCGYHRPRNNQYARWVWKTVPHKESHLSLH